MSMIGKLCRSKSIVFCCDVQERFRDIIQNFGSVLYVSKTMNKASSVLNLPFVVTEQYPKALGHTCSEVGYPTEPTEGYHLFEKKKFSMLTDNVEQLLKEKYPERNQVLLFGIEAHVCVLQTTLDLLERNYQVHILADGVSSRNAFDRSVAFDRLRQSGAFITTSESALFQLMGSADFEKFKEISNLVKDQKPNPGTYP
ncbi:hypothetical protein ABK040_016288 [Willaertia magna]